MMALNFSLSHAGQTAVTSGRPVEQKADSIYELIVKELQFSNQTKEKFKAIQNAMMQLKHLLTGEDEMNPEQAEYVQEYIVALQSLPSAKGFKRNRCPSYQVEDKAKAILQGLCD